MKIKKILSVFMIMLTIFSMLSVNVSALTWDGSSAGGSTSAVNGSSKGYVIRSTIDDNCVVGYRFSVVNSAGNLKVNKVIDVYRNTSNGDNAYSTSAKFSTKYNKKQLIANKDATLKTTSNTTNCYKEKDMGFVSKLPNPSGVETWQKYETNINKVLTKIGVGTVSNMSYGDKVIIEPLFDVCLAGEYQALTVTEIAYCGRSVKGGSSDGGTSNGTSSTWGFIANYTNRIWPNKLYTPNGQGLWTAASKIADSSKETFNNLLTKGYGVGIAYTESSAPVLTIAYDCYGSNARISDSSKGFTFGDYNRLCTTSTTNKTIAGTANVFYNTVAYDNTLGTNGLHDFATFGLSAPTGYKFKSWHGAKGDFDETTRYKASQLSDDIKNGDTYIWLTAKFEPITYSVRFNGNGSTSGSMANESFTYDVAKALTANAFKREFTVTYNYNVSGLSNATATASATFNGWALTSTGTKIYSDKQSISNLASTQGAVADIYAKWTDGNVTLPTPTRTGYTFSGWYTSASGGTKVGNGGDKYTPSSNITLYAHWSQEGYTVTYNANGGSGAPSSQTKTYGVDLTLSSTKPTRTGYAFSKWNTKSDGTGTSYSSGGKYTSNSSVTLYAQWTPNTYTVTYNANGGSGAPSSQTKTHGVNLTLSSTKPTRTGYTFNKWNTKSDGTGTNYSSGGSYTSNSSVTLYAQWTPNTYTVTYNANGGSGAPSSQTKTYGVDLTLSSTKPTKTGYTFSKWNTMSDGTGTSYSSGGSYTSNSNITLYAQWTPNTYTVKFYLDGVEQTSLSKTCTYGTSYTYPSVPTKSGYTVTGWWSGSVSILKGTQYAAGASFSNLTSTNGGTVKRYAYSESKSYTVHYYLDGVEQNSLKQTCSYDSTYKYQTVPSKTGYTVSGWWSGSSASSKGTQYAAGASFSNLTSTDGGTIKRYAYSTPITYEVKFNGNGSTSGSMNNQKFTYDVSQNLSSNAFKREFTVTYNYNGNGTANTTAKANAIFNGWAKTTSGTKVYDDKQNVSNLASTQDAVVNLYAKWTDGSVILPTPTRTGYVFDGWYTTTTGTTKVGNGGASYTPAKDITVYAHWKPLTYTVNYYLDGVEQTSLKQTCSYDSTYKYQTVPTKTGYTVSGWWSGSSASSKGTQYAAGSSFSNLTSTNGGTIKRYAYSTPITYEVKFNGNGSTSGSMNNQKFTYDVSQNLSSNAFKREFTVTYNYNGNGTANTTAKANAVFNGWAKTTSGAKVYDNKQNVSNLASTQDAVVNLYAKWTDGSVTLPTPTRTGYVFDGWYTTTTGTTKVGNGGASYTPAKDITVYAHWTPITYTIKFDGNGYSSGSTASMTMTYNIAANLTANGFVRDGYKFTKWNTKADGTGTDYENKQNVLNLTTENGKVITLYAQWEETQSLRLEAIEPNADYRENTEVISSFYIINEGSTDCIPDNNISVIFKVYKNSTVIKTVTLEKVVVPAGDKNLIYFKWAIPENIGTATMYISGEIVSNGHSDSFIKNAYATCKYVISSTPDTQYEYSAPEHFSVPASPVNSNTTATWSEWKYENGVFRKYNYGIGISDDMPTLKPAASANASFANGIWMTKSGYGVEITLANGMKSVNGYTMPSANSYTAPQYSTVMFPEFSFMNTLNNYRTLELINNNWIFRENGNYGRIHFTPLWYPDGLYSVNVVQRDCWTPAGMISRSVNTEDIKISGSAYDDWYLN